MQAAEAPVPDTPMFHTETTDLFTVRTGARSNYLFRNRQESGRRSREIKPAEIDVARRQKASNIIPAAPMGPPVCPCATLWLPCGARRAFMPMRLCASPCEFTHHPQTALESPRQCSTRSVLRAILDVPTLKPGWRNRQTQRT